MVRLLKESFAKWANLKIVLLVLLGATAGQGIVWYTGQFYALSFMQSVMKLDIVRSSIIVATAIFFAMPFSDRIGRLKIMMAVALMTFLVGTFGLSESHRVEIWREAEDARPA